jgi:hypothetical protein
MRAAWPCKALLTPNGQSFIGVRAIHFSAIKRQQFYCVLLLPKAMGQEA